MPIDAVPTDAVPTDAELTAWPAHRLSTALAGRRLRVVDVVTAYLDRTDRLEPTHHALVSRRPRGEVLAEAAVLDAELGARPPRGWLHGLPLAVKDLADVRGLPTTCGLWPLDESPVATDDTDFVARLRAAGALFVGKTNTPQLGLGSHTYNDVAPTTRNALDPSLSAGGSSGGAAVAVATGMVPVADGSDFMGSLRNPPGWNGVFGLRPTAHDPTTTGDELVDDGGQDGPVARDARDLALLLATMAGTTPCRPTAGTTVRIGWLGDVVAGVPTEPGLVDVCRGGLDVLRAMGAEVVEAAVPVGPGFESLDLLWPTWLTFRHATVGRAIAELGVTGRLKPEAQWEVAGFRALAPAAVADLVQRRAGLGSAFHRLFAEVDLAVLPTAQVFPFPAERHWPTAVGGRRMDTYHRWMEITTPATLAGLPALAVPVPTDGAPIGLQVLAPWGRERLLLDLAAGWQAEVAGATGVALCRV